MSLQVEAFALDWSDPESVAVTLAGGADQAEIHLRFSREMADGFGALLQAAARPAAPVPGLRWGPPE